MTCDPGGFGGLSVSPACRPSKPMELHTGFASSHEGLMRRGEFEIGIVVAWRHINGDKAQRVDREHEVHVAHPLRVLP